MTKELSPTVTVRLYQGAELSMLILYLVQTLDGHYWAVPTPQEHLDIPDLSTAYQLESEHLKELPLRDHAGRRGFAYQEIWTTP
jgi:hypothetical protein